MIIEPTTLQFLNDLDRNNNREWFLAQKQQYEGALVNLKNIKEIIHQGVNKTDLLEDSRLFRIYRDVRFSKDKAPYKNNFGIHFTRATEKRRGGYYLHIEPGKSFAGGGFWAPEPKDLKRIREEFAFDAKPIRHIISSKTFKRYFKELGGEELKTAPSGFEKDHPAIDLIRKKQFIISRNFTDKEVVDMGFVNEVLHTFHAMRPFLDYMTDVLTTNLNGELNT